MPRKPFLKSPQSIQTVSINVREVPKDLHRHMRMLAFQREVSLGNLYGEALRVYFDHQADQQAKAV